MLKAEWQYVKQHRFMLLVVSVLCFLPALYAVPFLGSLWNTYGNVDELPVAVVNHDRPVKYHKQTVDVGDQLVHELKQSKDLDFTFTNSKKAQKGLKDGQYYMVMTIPENFSKDATSLLDKHPRKMQLDYATSSGHSFIGGKLSESAANKMQQRVSESVTQAYTKAMFSEIKKAGDGIGKAADGSQKLADGSGKIKNGQQQLADGLNTLAQSSLTFGAGAQKLDVGLKQYVDGVGQAGQGNQAVGQGLQQMQGQLPAFNQGVTALSAGQTKLNTGVQSYTDAVSQLTTGSEQVTQGLAALQDATQKGQLDPKKINQVKSDLTDLERIIDEAKAKQGAAPDAQAVTQKIESSLTALAEMQKISAGRDAHVNAAIDQTAKEQKLTPEQTQALKQSVQASQASDQAQMDAQVAVLQKNTADLQQAISPMVKSLTENQATLTRIAQHAQGLPAEMPAIEQQVTQLQALPSAVTKLTDGSKQVTSGLQQLKQKSGELNQGSQQLNAGVNQMAKQIAPLQNGVAQLVAGNGKVQTGLNTLQDKGGQLAQGSTQLADGSTQLQQGSQKLNQGAQQMGPALQQVQQGNQKLSDQLDQATKRVNDLPADKQTYAQMAQPAKTKHKERDQVPNNGTGMAPYMFSVGLFVGMLGINLMIDLVQPRTTIYALWRWVGSKLVILLGIATMMAIVLFFLSKWLLGMTYVDGPATLGLLILIAWMDALLVTAINLWFGRAGSFVSVVLLVAQLSLSAGTYPIQLSPEIYQKLHAWVPMTYTVNGLRQTMMIGQAPTQAVHVMLGIMLVSLVAMILFYIRQHRHGFNLISE